VVPGDPRLVVPDVVSNSLVVSGPAYLLRNAKNLVAELDRAPMMVRVEVVIGDVPAASVPPAEAGANADPAKS